MKTKLELTEIESKVVGETYFNTSKSVICVLTLLNSYEVIGTSGVVDTANFKLEVGSDIAKKRAIDKVWELEGYLLQQELHKAKEL